MPKVIDLLDESNYISGRINLASGFRQTLAVKFPPLASELPGIS